MFSWGYGNNIVTRLSLTLGSKLELQNTLNTEGLMRLSPWFNETIPSVQWNCPLVLIRLPPRFNETVPSIAAQSWPRDSQLKTKILYDLCLGTRQTCKVLSIAIPLLALHLVKTLSILSVITILIIHSQTWGSGTIMKIKRKPRFKPIIFMFC